MIWIHDNAINKKCSMDRKECTFFCLINKKLCIAPAVHFVTIFVESLATVNKNMKYLLTLMTNSPVYFIGSESHKCIDHMLPSALVLFSTFLVKKLIKAFVIL